MTAEEIYLNITCWLFAQNKPCQDYFGFARYRHGVLKSPIGVLISDDLYDESLESAPLARVRSVVEQSVGRPLDETEWALVSELQFIHNMWPPEVWPALCRYTRERYLKSWNGLPVGSTPAASSPS
ncbi:MAG: hypothetical protein KatS3mg105_3278 [Gemmatales bacterium]|nr:MAG: hypothetical protein KatS3mg105_3278 [Gemmatales bacterium]